MALLEEISNLAVQRKNNLLLQGQHFKIRNILNLYPQEQFTAQTFCRNTKRGNSISRPRDEAQGLISSGHPSAGGFLQTTREKHHSPGKYGWFWWRVGRKRKVSVEKWATDRNHPQTSIPTQFYWEYFCYFYRRSRNAREVQPSGKHRAGLCSSTAHRLIGVSGSGKGTSIPSRGGPVPAPSAPGMPSQYLQLYPQPGEKKNSQS